MNSCILITSHLNTPEKVEIADNLIKDLKQKTELPIILVGNYPLSLSLQHKVNYSLYTDYNPTAKNPRYIVWQGRSSLDYGYAHFTQILTAMKFIQNLGFEYAHHFNYDVVLEEGEFDRLIEKGSNGDFLYYAWGNDGISTSFFSIKPKEFINTIEPNLHYYDNGNPPGIRDNWFAEVFFEWAFLQKYPNLSNYCDIEHKTVSLSF